MMEYKKEAFKEITLNDFIDVSKKLSKRWKLVNHGKWYNCIDTNINQKPEEIRFESSQEFHCKLKKLYLEKIGENESYFYGSQYTIQEREKRINDLYTFKYTMVKFICGYDHFK